MNKHSFILTVLLAGLCAVCAAARPMSPAKRVQQTVSIEALVDAAVQRAQARQTAGHGPASGPCHAEELSTQEYIEAEEELQHIRNVQDSNATFEKYPYLLDPAYRRGDAQTRQKIRRAFRRVSKQQK